MLIRWNRQPRGISIYHRNQGFNRKAVLCCNDTKLAETEVAMSLQHEIHGRH